MPEYEKQTIRHIAGNVGADPERREGRENSTFVTFSVAVTRGYDDSDEARWYGVSVNREALQDEVMAQVHKGSRVVIEGVPTTSKGNDGRTFYNFKAFRVGLVDYLAVAGATQQSFDSDFEDEDDL
jgi:single-stranded DNA-binding protein